MLRHLSRAIGALGALLWLATPAEAAPPAGPPVLTITGVPGRRLVIDAPSALDATPHAQVSRRLYLERCVGGCRLRMGPNDARAHSTMLILVPEATIGEFWNSAMQTGAAADDEWRQIVRCMAEVYSPYDVVVTDEKPTSGGYHEAIIAGRPEQVGRSSDILGVAPLANDCSAIDNVISLSFANQHAAANRVLNICWTAAQESAHAFGLDHVYSFLAGNRSACNDPMTYRNDCGGQKFFRNEAASCGENAARACRCGTSQNSHRKLLSVFGAGAPITGTPTITLTSPMTGGALGRDVVSLAGARRGIARVELYVNGFKWAEQAGARFGADGQPDPSVYAIPVPLGLPDSIVDVKTVAYDDLGASTESAVVTVTKGAPCTTADGCAVGQRCEAGRCFWDPPVGEIGDACAYPQFCHSGICQGPDDEPICTQDCSPGVADGCPAEFACVATSSPTRGTCLFASGGGCCSVDRGAPGWAHLGFGALMLGFVRRRRRRFAR